MRVDTHMHSEHSIDSCSRVIDIYNESINRQMDIIALTDHIDLGMYSSKRIISDARKSIDDILSIQKMQKSCKILKGMELGQAVQHKELSKEIIQTFDHDFIILSVHSTKGYEDFYSMPREDMLAFGDKALDTYFDELLENTQSGLGDTLAHISYPLRYFLQRHVEVNLDKYMPKIGEILRSLIKNDMALECNTSGLRQPIGETLPSMQIFQMYYDLGGKLITMGSDSHRICDIYDGIEEASADLRKIGFKEACYFENRSPILYKLP